MTTEELRDILSNQDIVYLVGTNIYSRERPIIKFAVSVNLSRTRRSGYLFYTDVSSFCHFPDLNNYRIPGYSNVQHVDRLENIIERFSDIKIDTNVTLFDIV